MPSKAEDQLKLKNFVTIHTLPAVTQIPSLLREKFFYE